MEDHE
jgi:hypothetical protein